MTHSHSYSHPALTMLACVTLALSMLAACASPDGGYYDASGNWISTDTPYNKKAEAHSPLPGGDGYYRSERENNGYYNNNHRDGYRYSHRGYYDYNGNYIDRAGNLNAPESMFPPRGMCRVWFAERMNSEQPAVESCDNIKSRVPAGAYVIYGG